MKKTKAKVVKAWALVGEDGDICPGLLFRCLKNTRKHLAWYGGYRVIRVEIRELPRLPRKRSGGGR